MEPKMGENSQKPVAKSSMSGNRLAKVMARNGLCSRRQAEQWIKEGRVRVNNELIRTPAFNVSDTDSIEVDGTPIAERTGTRVWLYHKPAGLVVTESDPEGRPTVFEEFARRGLPRVLSVGRLDINTEGLLMLTNDGGLKRTLELPATGWLRRYRVRAHGRITQDQLDKLKHGLVVDGVKYGAIDAKLEREQGSNVWLIVALSEGKNREIKNVLLALGLQVNRLIRTSFGPFQLGDIPVGGIDTVKARVLQDQLGQKLARKAGVDFDAPMPDPIAPQQQNNSARSKVRRAGIEASKSFGKSDDEEQKDRKQAKPRTMGFRGRDDSARRGAARAPEEVEMRKVHFSSGRASEMFTPQAKSKRPDRPGRPDRSGRPERASGPNSRSSHPKSDRSKSDRPRSDRPRPDRPKSGRPKSNRPKPTRK
jgi:23S rRNA pseudouridine2605 synthase